MYEQILKNKPLGATHWQAGVYYKENHYGVWFKWYGKYWDGSFQFPDILCMTTLK